MFDRLRVIPSPDHGAMRLFLCFILSRGTCKRRRIRIGAACSVWHLETAIAGSVMLQHNFQKHFPLLPQQNYSLGFAGVGIVGCKDYGPSIHKGHSQFMAIALSVTDMPD